MYEQLCLFSQEEMDSLLIKAPPGTVIVRCFEDGEEIYNMLGEQIGTYKIEYLQPSGKN